MSLPDNVVANADDLGYNGPVNNAILFCFEHGYINSASLMTNTPGFDEAVVMIKQNTCMKNIGVHINMAEGKPLTAVGTEFLTADGNWQLNKMNKVLQVFSKKQKALLAEEINQQINKAIAAGVEVSHLDSHYHLHTLPALSGLFLDAARNFGLKLRLAQTYREGSYIKFAYRRYLNYKMISAGINYSTRFETVAYFLAQGQTSPHTRVEVMLHPGYNSNGMLTDHYDADTMQNWLGFLQATAL